METVLAGLVRECCLDDILVIGETFEERFNNLQKVLVISKKPICGYTLRRAISTVIVSITSDTMFQHEDFPLILAKQKLSLIFRNQTT